MQMLINLTLVNKKNDLTFKISNRFRFIVDYLATIYEFSL